jgi:type IV secretory pathway component VirB8
VRAPHSPVRKVSIEDLRSAPYKATVDFYKISYSPAQHVEVKRTLYTAHFVFLFRDSVPNELIQVNPLGVAITYFREDEAFQ